MYPTVRSSRRGNLGMEDYAGIEVPDSHRRAYRPESEGKQSVSGSIAIKGTRSGLLLTLEAGMPFSELLQALARRLEESPTFFRGASLTVDTTQRALRVSERLQLEKLLAQYQMSIAANATEAANATAKEPRAAKTITLPETPQIARASHNNAHAAHSTPPAQSLAPEQRDPRDHDDILYLRRTVRSGQAIHHHSSIVILGDVNPGAEIVAGGDIIVWGVLRGMVHAGYPDNEQALVCSLQLAPVQLRIAHLLSRPPEGFEAQPRPEVATIRQGQIIVEAWISGRPPRK
jgi:septum site-determining protein MinC